MRAACVVRPAEFASLSPARAASALPRAPTRTLQDGPRVCLSHLRSASARRTLRALRPPAQRPTRRNCSTSSAVPPPTPSSIASLPLDPEGRTWVRLDGPGGSEAWLIGWPPGTGTGWHDHADSRRRLRHRGRRAQGALARRPAAHRRLEDPGTGRGRGPRAAAGRRPGPGLRPPPCARGAQRVRRASTRSRSTPTIRRCRRSAATAARARCCGWSRSSARRTGSERRRDATSRRASTSCWTGSATGLDRASEPPEAYEAARPARPCWWTSGTRPCASGTA